MSRIDLFSFEIARRSVNLPPGVADVAPPLCADEQTRRDYTGGMRAAREAQARIIIRHAMYLAMQRVRHR